LSAHAAESLVRYPWPGNIRELFNVIEHMHVMTRGSTIELADLPAPLNNFGFVGRTSSNDLNLQSIERRTIIEALKRTRYNRAAACRMLGIEKRRLNRRLTVLGIPVRPDTEND
jgi:DNA-binding NtrC family response regulator